MKEVSSVKGQVSRGVEAVAHGSGPWLAGAKTDTWICYVCFDSKPTNPGWTPYAAMAERWKCRKDAELAARTAVKVFGLKDAIPVLQDEDQPFRGSGMECECLNDQAQRPPAKSV